MALQRRGAEGPRRTDAGPQMEVGDQRVGRQQEAGRRLRARTETADLRRVRGQSAGQIEVKHRSHAGVCIVFVSFYITYF